MGYNAPLPIKSPDADSIEKVALIRVSAVTHSVNMEQRYVPLDYDVNGTTLAATSPENANIAPPGVYMLFVIDEDGVPSESKMVRVDLTVLPCRTRQRSGHCPRPPPTTTTPRSGDRTGGSTVGSYGTPDCGGAPLESGDDSRVRWLWHQRHGHPESSDRTACDCHGLAGKHLRLLSAVFYIADSTATNDPHR